MISLDGQFKVDIYNQEGELVESSDYFNNFITTTGLAYPHTMPFADTFHFLSLGTDDRASDINTTGIYKFVDGKDYNEATHDAFSHLTGWHPESCGFVETASGVDLFRGWRVPESGGAVMHKDFTFKELQVAPGRPGKQSEGAGGAAWLYTGGWEGLESPTSGLTAFSRVKREFTIPSGDFAIISYKLLMAFDTGIHVFPKFISLDSPNTSHTQGHDNVTSPPLWENLTGTSRLFWPGIRVVLGPQTENAGVHWKQGGENQPIPYGATVMFNKVGEPMEPSVPGSHLRAWFSTDNTQYTYNSYMGGKAFKNSLEPWNTTNGATMLTASGHPEWFNNVYALCSPEENEGGGGGGGGGYGGNDWEAKSKADLITGLDRLDRFIKYRIKDSKLPLQSDYLEEDEAVGMSTAGFSWNGQVITSFNHSCTVTQYNGLPGTSNAGDFTKRTRKSTRVSSWLSKNAIQDYASQDFMQYRSLAFGSLPLNDPDNKIYPVFDSLFATHVGEFQPTGSALAANMQDFSFTGSTGYYPFQDGNNGVSITWKLSWSAPCGGVSNCTEP